MLTVKKLLAALETHLCIKISSRDLEDVLRVPYRGHAEESVYRVYRPKCRDNAK